MPPKRISLNVFNTTLTQTFPRGQARGCLRQRQPGQGVLFLNLRRYDQGGESIEKIVLSVVPPRPPPQFTNSPLPTQNEKKNSEKNSKKNNENVDTVNRRVTMTPTGSPSKKKAKAAPPPVGEESGHDTDASDDEYWAKKQKQSKPKPSTQTFVTGTAVTKNKKSGSIRDYDKVRKLAPVLFHSLRYSNTLTRIVMPTSLRPSQDSKLYTVLFESGERKTFKENQIRKMLTSKGEKVSEEDLADMEVEESDKAESDEEFGEGEQDISAGSRSLRTASPSF